MERIHLQEIHGREVCRLPKQTTQIRVLVGNTWVTAFGKDIILRRGESALFVAGKHDAVVTALGEQPLVLEELG